MKSIRLVITIVLFSTTLAITGQVSENNIGVRGGIHSGVYFQNLRVTGNAESSFMALLSANNNSFRLAIMKLTYETSLDDLAEGLFFTWGYGGHAGITITDHAWFLGRKYQFEYERLRPVAGVDGWFGLEYRFAGFPVAVGLNAKPFFEIMVPGFFTIQPGDIGLSVAYRF